MEAKLNSLDQEGTISWIAANEFDLTAEQRANWENDKDDPHKQISLCFALCLGPDPETKRAELIVRRLIDSEPPSAYYAIATDIANLLGDQELLKFIVEKAGASGRMDEDYRWYKRYVDFHAGLLDHEDMRQMAEPFAEDLSMYYYAVAMKAWSEALRSKKAEDWQKVKEYLQKTVETGTVTFWEYSIAKAIIDNKMVKRMMD